MNKARILIVEDEAIIALELKTNLRSLGYEVTSVVNTGEEAIKKAEADKPDLILMDIRIKGELDGIEAAEVIRNRFGIPVIFSTAYLDEERIERAKITMPFGYVLKPFQEKDLKITIQMALYVAKVDAERRRTEVVLRENEEKHRNLLESIEDWVWSIDVNGVHTYSNKAVESILGYTVNEVLGTSSYPIMHADDQDRIQDVVRKSIEKKEGWDKLEIRWIHKDGSIRYIVSSSKPIFDGENLVGFSGIDHNITERKQAEETLIAEQRFMQTVLDSTDDTFFVFAPSTGKAVRWNRAFREASGYSDEEIQLLKAPDSYYSVDDLNKAKATMEQVQKEGYGSAKLDLITKNGRLITTEYRVAIVADTKNDPKYLVSIGRQISESNMIGKAKSQ